MLWTIVGGFTFLGCQAWEWSHFIHGTDLGSRLLDGSIIYGANLQITNTDPLTLQHFSFSTGFMDFMYFLVLLFKFFDFLSNDCWYL